MIRKLVRQMLTAQILSALTVSLCLLIDSVMIGRYLGSGAIAAYGLANPVLLILGAVGSMLSAGVQVVCGKTLGMGSRKETDAGFSTAVAVSLAVSLLLGALILVFRKPLAALLGAGGDAVLFSDTQEYMAGFILGAPASVGSLVLVPFLQLAGKSGLLIVAVAAMTVADVLFDLLNVLVFRGGMFGMGLASSLSYYVALLIGGAYFFSKRCVFHFSLRSVARRKVTELFRCGLPTVFNMASGVVLIFVMNRLLLQSPGGNSAVAAFSVICTVGNAGCCICTGIGGVSLTLSGILYHEEDRTGLNEMLRSVILSAPLLGIPEALLLVVFAPACVGLFLPEPGPLQQMAVLGLRLYTLGMIPCCLCNALKNAYQGCGKVRLTEIISVCECALLPSLAAAALIRLGGTDAAWFYFFAGETAALLAVLLYVRVKLGRFPARADDLLLLDSAFGVPEEDLLEADIRNLEDVTAVAEKAGAFCIAKGGNRLFANRISLCIEELGSNTVTYGFADGGNHHLSVRVQRKEDRWILRFRDDCSSFDPVRYLPGRQDQENNTGLRLVMGIAQNVLYTYSMNLNNLTVLLKPPEEIR